MEKFECGDCGCFYWVKDRNDFDCPNCEQIDLWLKADEENRKHNIDKALKLKDEFHQKYIMLDKKDQKNLNEYLDSIGA